MTGKLITPPEKDTAVAPPRKISEPGIRPLMWRICIVWLFIFFADTLLDFFLDAMDTLIDLISTSIDLLFEFEDFLATEFIAQQFDLTNRQADIVVFYGLLPFGLLLLGYIIIKFFRGMKRLPEKFKRWKFKEITLIENSWLLLDWYWKLAVVSAMLSPIASFFLF